MLSAWPLCSQKWHKFTKRGREEQQGRDSFQDFVQPYLRDLRSRGKYSEGTLQSLGYPESEEINYELIATLVHKIHTRDGRKEEKGLTEVELKASCSSRFGGFQSL